MRPPPPLGVVIEVGSWEAWRPSAEPDVLFLGDGEESGPSYRYQAACFSARPREL
jgi:hypothetical protein